LGADLSGTVVQVGPGVKGFAVGQELFGVTNERFTGAYAEYAVVDVAGIAPRPKRLSHVEAGGSPVVGVTAWQMLFEHGAARSGERVLVHGAGGNVGALAVQMARALGASVMGTDIGEGVGYARSLGDGPIVDMKRERFEDQFRDIDLVLDTVGGEVQRRSFDVLKPGGRLISSVSEPEPALAAAHGVEARFMLVKVTTVALMKLGELLESGQLVARVGAVLPLARARDAHEMLAGVQPRPPGKLVLQVR
jgi:NADPH:quinone reductase-like Zn-dependent oxidoreductase